jgi:hypothetical protein
MKLVSYRTNPRSDRRGPNNQFTPLSHVSIWRSASSLATPLLQPARKLGTLALDHIEVVVGELAPLLLNLAFELFPVAFDAIPIHGFLLFLRHSEMAKEPWGQPKVPMRDTNAARGTRSRKRD